jgi:CRP-like cAMP-binding protein
LKNAEKIKYLKYCPFFLWSDQLSEDLASCMSFCTFEKEEVIYFPHSPATHIFFVKEGVVLLERNEQVGNSIVKEYESHYENNEINEN